ncbi:ferredoxin [Nocardioides humi]|uniref:Ferredoxin n=1 Tax=Nocardioides humi TaxID=449461 RepID=A0ABN2A3V2_9ACTN|nr:ferredoxin [Nocardioides humi]
MSYVITVGCVDVKDRSCVEECPVDCIYEGSRSLYIHPDECVDCGACEPVCPQEAIYFDGELPEEWEAFVRVGREVFAEIGSPGGARRREGVLEDHPHVAALPAGPGAVDLEGGS